MKIASILEGSDGQVFPDISGEVTFAGARAQKEFSYNGENISQMVQFIYLKDDTGSAGVELRNKPEILKGTKVTIKSAKTKHGLQGVKMNAYADKKTGEVKKVIRVTGSAEVAVDGAPVSNTTPASASAPTPTSVAPAPGGFKSNYNQRRYSFEERTAIYKAYFGYFKSTFGDLTPDALADLTIAAVTGHTLSGADPTMAPKDMPPKAASVTKEDGPSYQDEEIPF